MSSLDNSVPKTKILIVIVFPATNLLESTPVEIAAGELPAIPAIFFADGYLP